MSSPSDLSHQRMMMTAGRRHQDIWRMIVYVAKTDKLLNLRNVADWLIYGWLDKWQNALSWFFGAGNFCSSRRSNLGSCSSLKIASLLISTLLGLIWHSKIIIIFNKNVTGAYVSLTRPQRLVPWVLRYNELLNSDHPSNSFTLDACIMSGLRPNPCCEYPLRNHCV